MINANDIQSVVNSLKCKATNENNLINILCDNYIKNINNSQIELSAVKLMLYDDDDIKNTKIKEIENKINGFKNKIKLIHARIQEGNNCPICFDSPTHKTIVNCCNNPFCLNCIIAYLDHTKKNICPLCRSTEIDPNKFLISYEDKIKTLMIKKVKTRRKSLKIF